MLHYFYICPECDQQDTENCESICGADMAEQLDYQAYVEMCYDAATPGICIFCGKHERLLHDL